MKLSLSVNILGVDMVLCVKRLYYKILYLYGIVLEFIPKVILYTFDRYGQNNESINRLSLFATSIGSFIDRLLQSFD